MSSASAETAPERPPVQVKVEPNNEYIDGIAVDGFEDVKEVFQCATQHLAHFQVSNFRDRLEHDGAALAVYHKGKLVVDLWGGWADRENDRNWTRDTIANIFSCTKGVNEYALQSVAAICVAMKVDKKECAYTDKVSKCWPEFGRNGKEDITIDMILTHRAGLPYFEEDITLDEAADRVKISKIIEEEIPKFPPGSKIAYHPITFGWLIDQSIEMFNSPSVRAFGQPAVNGVASARGLALLHQIFMDGTLVSHEFFEGSWQIGHSAMGGQCIRMDPSNELVICYLTNALKAGSGKHTLTYNKLQTKIYEILATKKICVMGVEAHSNEEKASVNELTETGAHRTVNIFGILVQGRREEDSDMM
ncbi:beta-lactamase [Ancylostoma ceylanicum]|uniref:Beta-lactamase n=1 Tax=Ancylostoma ceylanicum TaxID=53326 RepID=A0A0D6LPC0_9BILA|nr:beta-lactamase [Ancylostoma ceylanicum]